VHRTLRSPRHLVQVHHPLLSQWPRQQVRQRPLQQLLQVRTPKEGTPTNIRRPHTHSSQLKYRPRDHMPHNRNMVLNNNTRCRSHPIKVRPFLLEVDSSGPISNHSPISWVGPISWNDPKDSGYNRATVSVNSNFQEIRKVDGQDVAWANGHYFSINS